MDVGADNFRFTLEDQNGRKKACRTVRKAKTCELHLSSLDRYKPSDLVSNSQFQNFPVQPLSQIAGVNLLNGNTGGANQMQIQTSAPLIQGYFSRIALTQMNILYRQPTIVSASNGVLIMFIGGGQGWSTYTIPNGYYTPASLALQITNGIRASNINLPNFTCFEPGRATSAGKNNNQGFGFSTNSAVTMYFGFPPLGVGITDDQVAAFARAVRILGLDRTTFGYATPSPAGSQETAAPTPWTDVRSTRACTMRYTDYIDVCSTYLSNYKDAKDTNTNIAAHTCVLGRIWLTEANMSIGGGFQGATPGIPYDAALLGAPIAFTKTWSSPNWCQWSPNQTIDNIDILLRDMYGNRMQWYTTYPTEWSATLTLTE